MFTTCLTHIGNDIVSFVTASKQKLIETRYYYASFHNTKVSGVLPFLPKKIKEIWICKKEVSYTAWNSIKPAHSKQ